MTREEGEHGFEGKIAFGYIRYIVALQDLRRWSMNDEKRKIKNSELLRRSLKTNIAGEIETVPRLACSGARPGSEAGRCTFWLSVKSPGRSSWADAAVSDASRCLDPGLEVG